MDRLICGDAGFGKTEVALRASFRAVMDGRQVAVLVPTTILAEQHYQTFLERFRDYPVQVACLNRFRSRVQQTEIVAGIQRGTVDIVIGTHRLLQKDVAFKNLGLVIIDESSGVPQGKAEKAADPVDVLTLTATPIPGRCTCRSSASGPVDHRPPPRTGSRSDLLAGDSTNILRRPSAGRRARRTGILLHDSRSTMARLVELSSEAR